MIKPLSNTIQQVINFTWPMVIISVVIMVSFRISYLIANKQKFVLYKELLMLIFGVYILCLFQVVTFQDDTSWASNNFIPFQEILRYDITSRLFIKNVLGNMIMFLPFGFFVSYYLKVEKIHLPIILTLIASVSIELVQLAIGRVFDVDDIILNMLGGIIGYFIYDLLRIIGSGLPKFCKSEWFLNILSVVLFIGLILMIVLVL
ncbi:MAG: VanZ family protein [Bacilli bacterium]|nr:VanZ family protein [Bacilli bacterium]